MGDSAPIDCLDDAGLDAFLGMDPTPDDLAEEQAFVKGAKALADGCKARGGALLAHVSTVDAAKDMDILRATLGEAKLHYLGKSYGTFLGSTYAGLFPAKVGRFVLDGVVPPDLTSSELSQGQARGFEEATRAYVANCIKRSSCPVGSTVDEGMQWLRDFLKGLDGQPIRVTTDAKITELNEAWAAVGLANAMYSQQAWPSLTSALIAAQNGDCLLYTSFPARQRRLDVDPDVSRRLGQTRHRGHAGRPGLPRPGDRRRRVAGRPGAIASGAA